MALVHGFFIRNFILKTEMERTGRYRSFAALKVGRGGGGEGEGGPATRSLRELKALFSWFFSSLYSEFYSENGSGQPLTKAFVCHHKN